MLQIFDERKLFEPQAGMMLALGGLFDALHITLEQLTKPELHVDRNKFEQYCAKLAEHYVDYELKTNNPCSGDSNIALVSPVRSKTAFGTIAVMGVRSDIVDNVLSNANSFDPIDQIESAVIAAISISGIRSALEKFTSGYEYHYFKVSFPSNNSYVQYMQVDRCMDVRAMLWEIERMEEFKNLEEHNYDCH